jgi:hypothetical protein
MLGSQLSTRAHISWTNKLHAAFCRLSDSFQMHDSRYFIKQKQAALLNCLCLLLTAHGAVPSVACSLCAFSATKLLVTIRVSARGNKKLVAIHAAIRAEGLCSRVSLVLRLGLCDLPIDCNIEGHTLGHDRFELAVWPINNPEAPSIDQS